MSSVHECLLRGPGDQGAAVRALVLQLVHRAMDGDEHHLPALPPRLQASQRLLSLRASADQRPRRFLPRFRPDRASGAAVAAPATHSRRGTAAAAATGAARPRDGGGPPPLARAAPARPCRSLVPSLRAFGRRSWPAISAGRLCGRRPAAPSAFGRAAGDGDECCGSERGAPVAARRFEPGSAPAGYAADHAAAERGGQWRGQRRSTSRGLDGNHSPECGRCGGCGNGIGLAGPTLHTAAAAARDAPRAVEPPRRRAARLGALATTAAAPPTRPATAASRGGGAGQRESCQAAARRLARWLARGARHGAPRPASDARPRAAGATTTRQVREERRERAGGEAGGQPGTVEKLIT